MVMKANATLGYEGAHSEQHDITKKFQVFPIFDAGEANQIIEGIKENVEMDIGLMSKYHGAKKDPGEVKSWVLDRTQKELGWIYSRINPALKHANKSWGFDLANIEHINMLEFGVSMNTEWHIDGFDPKTCRRKLTFSLMLSDPDEYRGGDVELWYGAERAALPRLRKGEMIVWPSFLLNRIAAVKRGPRQALVGWAVGKEPFS